MNSNWAKILLFSILFGVLGFILGRVCGSCGPRSCGNTEMMAGSCAHGGMMGKGKCCNMKGEKAMMEHDHVAADSSGVAK
ncbi:MAG: hypothetical protein WBB32_17105 [Flavobacteriales bacterium]|nr:hypothetical protein [Flavobacteriales bacterium]